MGSLYQQAVPATATSNAAFLSDPITPEPGGGKMQITILLSGLDAIIYLTRTRNGVKVRGALGGGTTAGGTAQVTGIWQTYQLQVREGATYNFEFSTDTTVDELNVEQNPNGPS